VTFKITKYESGQNVIMDSIQRFKNRIPSCSIGYDCNIGDDYMRNLNNIILKAVVGTKIRILYIIPEANDKYLTWEIQFKDSSNKTPKYCILQTFSGVSEHH